MATLHIFARAAGPYLAGDGAIKLGDPLPEGAPKNTHRLDPQRFEMLVKTKVLAKPRAEAEPKPETPREKEPSNG